MLTGVFVFGEAFPLLGAFAESTARGALTLPQALGISYGVVVGVIVAVALGAFAAAEWLERRAGRPIRTTGATGATGATA
jgi:ABC-type enterobactin transport system permease subunit